MAIARKKETFVLELDEMEVAVLMGLFAHVGGDPKKMGRKQVEAMTEALKEAGVAGLECDGEIVFQDCD